MNLSKSLFVPAYSALIGQMAQSVVIWSTVYIIMIIKSYDETLEELVVLEPKPHKDDLSRTLFSLTFIMRCCDCISSTSALKE